MPVPGTAKRGRMNRLADNSFSRTNRRIDSLWRSLLSLCAGNAIVAPLFSAGGNCVSSCFLQVEWKDFSALCGFRVIASDSHHAGLAPHFDARLRPGFRTVLATPQQRHELVQDFHFIDFSHAGAHQEMQAREAIRFLLFNELVVRASAAEQAG